MQLHFIVFNGTHIQSVIDEPKQVFARMIHLCMVLLRIYNVITTFPQGRHSYDCIHRRSHVMTHMR